ATQRRDGARAKAARASRGFGQQPHGFAVLRNAGGSGAMDHREQVVKKAPRSDDGHHAAWCMAWCARLGAKPALPQLDTAARAMRWIKACERAWSFSLGCVGLAKMPRFRIAQCSLHQAEAIHASEAHAHEEHQCDIAGAVECVQPAGTGEAVQ